MSVTTGDLKHYESANMPSDDISIAGGAKTTTEINASLLGGVLHYMRANPKITDSTKYQYGKSFVGNISEDSNLINAKAYLLNALDDVNSNGVISAVSSSTDDDGDYKIKVVGEDADEEVITEEIILDGTTPVNGALTFSKVFWIELRDVTSGSLVTANGNITISVNSIALGDVPEGDNCAIAIVSIGLVATLDDSGTTTNGVTAPSGIVFTKPKDYTNGISLANSGTLTFGSAQGIWWKMYVEGGLKPAPEITPNLIIEGDTA